MKYRFLSYIILFFFTAFFHYSKAQTDMSITIKDHNGNTEPMITCDYNFVKDHCITLTANYPEIRNTNDYTVSSLNYTPIGNFTEGTEVRLKEDDYWSEALPIGFNFCLYGMSFSSMVINDNGVISFDTQLAGAKSPFAIAGNVESGRLSPYTVFGVYHDMVNDPASRECSTGSCGKITYYTTGTAPFRKTVINYYRMNIFDCDNEKSTFQVVLYETTNVVEVYVKDKPASCKRDNDPSSTVNRALIGITGKDGFGKAPPGRNNEKWNTDSTGSEAWSFSPKGNSVPTIQWFDSEDEDTVLGDGKTLTVCPTKNTTYKVLVTFNICGTASLYGAISIKFAYDYPAAKPVERNVCYDGTTPDFNALIPEAVGSLPANYKKTLYNTQSEAIAGGPGVSGISNNQTLYLRVEHPANSNCFTVVPLTIYKRQVPNVKDTTIEKCILQNGTIKTIDPTKENILGLGTDVTALFYLNRTDAENNNTNYISTLDVTSLPKTYVLYARVFNKYAVDCSVKIIQVTLICKPQPYLPDVAYAECGPTYTVTNFNLTQYETSIPGYQSYFKFKYYTTQSSAMAGDGTYLSNPTKYNGGNGDVIYVRVDQGNTTYCPSIFRIIFTLKTSKLSAETQAFCDDGSGKATINLETYFTNLAGSSIKLINFYSDAEATTLLPNYKNFVVDQITTVYARYLEDGCYYTLPITLVFHKKLDKITLYNVCDTEKDGKGKEIFFLNNLTPTFAEGYPSTVAITYHATLDDVIQGKGYLTSITVTQGADVDVYVRITFSYNCYVVHKLSLHLIDYSFSANTHDFTAKICDNNQDDQEIITLTDYISSLITLSGSDNIKNYTFKFYTTSDNAYGNVSPIPYPGNPYTLKGFLNSPVSIYVRIDGNSTCFSVVKLIFENSNFINATNYPIYRCDEGSDGVEIFDLLTEYNPIKNMISDTNGLNITYYDTEEAANAAHPVTNKNPNNLIVNTQKFYLWVRFENSLTKCFTVRYIEINLEFPPKIRDIEVPVCDTDFDGNYTLNLEDLKSEIEIDNPEKYAFHYYRDPNMTDEITGNDIKKYTVENLSPGNDKSVYIKITRDKCLSECKATIFTKVKAPIKTQIPKITKCDDDFDGIIHFSLSELISKAQEMIPDADLADPGNTIQYSFYHTRAEAEKGDPKNQGNFMNITPHNDQVFVRISSSKYCPNIGVMNLEVSPLPVSTLEPKFKICPGETVSLNAGTGNAGGRYTWSTGETGINLSSITVNKPGKYWVTVTNTNNCSYTYHTEVTEYPKITISQIITGDSYITIKIEGSGSFEYSMNGTDWQDSNTFGGLKPDTYTIYIRSKENSCDPITVTGTIFKPIKNIITPNNDGINDIWTFDGLDMFKESSTIKIFNRYGKLVFEQTSKTEFVWNGYYLGRPLPTASYWYVIHLANGAELTGWILLKNHSDGVD